MKTCSKASDELRLEMYQVRSNLAADMDHLVENTRVLTDWHYYFRIAPWFWTGAAAFAGFLLVPSRAKTVRADGSQLAELAKERRLVVTEAMVKPKRSVAGSLGGLMGSLLLRAGVAIATKQIGHLIESFERAHSRGADGPIERGQRGGFHDHD